MGIGRGVEFERPLAISCFSRGFGGNQYRHTGINNRLAEGSSSSVSVGSSAETPHHAQLEIPSPQTSGKGLGEEGYLDEDTDPSLCVLQSDVLCRKKERQVPSYSGFVSVEHVYSDSNFSNGNSRLDSSFCDEDYVGHLDRCNRCLPDHPNKHPFSALFLFRARRNSLHVPEATVWLDNGSLGFLSSNETHQVVSEAQRSPGKLFHRRLPYFSCHECPEFASYKMDTKFVTVAWFPDQLRKIFPVPSSVNRVSRGSIESQESHHGSSTRQGKQNHVNLSDNLLQFHDDKEAVGEFGGASELCSSPSSTRANASHSNYHMDESAHISSSQRHKYSNRCLIEGGFASLSREEVFVYSSFLPTTCSVPGYFDGRLRLRLEWCSFAFPDSGLLDAMGTFQVHKLEGGKSNLQHSMFFPGQSIGQSYQDSYRQYGSFILLAKDGFSELTRDQRHFKTVTFIVSPTQYCISGCPHLRMSECACGPRFQSGAYYDGMVLRSRVIRLDLPSISVFPSSGSFCHEGQFTIQSVCVSLPGREGLLSGCPSSTVQLESPFPVHLCFSSPKVDARFNRSNLSVRGDNGPDSSSYQRSLEFQITHESSTMETSSSEVLPISGSKSRDCVPGVQVLESFCLADSASKPEVSVGDAPSLGDEKSRCSPVPRMSSDVSQLGGPFLDQEDLDSFILDSFDEGELRMVQVDGELDLTTSQIKSRLEVWAHGLRTKGFSPEASSLIVGSHKNSSQHQYQSGWKQWLNYLKQENITDRDVCIATVCNFLAKKFCLEERALNTIKNYYYAIRDPLKFLYKLDIYTCVEISQLFAGAFQLRPPKKAIELWPRWDFHELLDYLCSSVFEPLEQAPWDKIMVKTIILILINTGRRMCEIAALTIEFQTPSSNVVILNWIAGFLAKAQREFLDWTPKLPQIVASPVPHDLLCPVRAFRIYHKLRLAKGRSAYNGMLWSASKINLSYLVIGTVKNSIRLAHPGISNEDVPKVGCHHFRKLACSYSWKFFNGTLDSLCERVGTKSPATLLKHYIRDVPGTKVPLQVPLGCLMPNTRVCHPLSNK